MIYSSHWANLGLETWGKNTYVFIDVSIYLNHLTQLHTHTHTHTQRKGQGV